MSQEITDEFKTGNITPQIQARAKCPKGSEHNRPSQPLNPSCNEKIDQEQKHLIEKEVSGGQNSVAKKSPDFGILVKTIEYQIRRFFYD